MMSIGTPAARGETAPATRSDVQWVGFVSSATACVTWVVARLGFRGAVPVEVYGVIQFGVPMALGWIAGEIRWRTARRRGTSVPSSDEAD